MGGGKIGEQMIDTKDGRQNKKGGYRRKITCNTNGKESKNRPA